ncbi:MAG TPA: porin [Allosphingosinicella sp.]|jgi:hypothetical protein
MKIGAVAGTGCAALAALSLVLTPAMAASTENRLPKPRLSIVIQPGGFTPAVTDPRLAAELARRGLQPSSFRLTPATIAFGRGKKAVRVAVRARATTTAEAVRHASAPTQLAVTAITPTVYNLGVSIGWQRFALSGDVDHVRGGTIPGGREAAQLGVSYSLSRFTARLEAAASRADPDTPRLLLNDDNSYTLGLGGSYRLTRNLDVTGGVRYKIQNDRLELLTDQRRDSEAVYIGTAFHF